MALPNLQAWLTDYFTANAVMTGTNAALQGAFEAMCANGTLKFCACEQKSFKKDPATRPPFWDLQRCRCDLNLDIAKAASALPSKIGGRKMHPTDNSAKTIAACAIVMNYGVISAKLGHFLTVSDLAGAQGVTCLDLPTFQNLYP